MESTTEDQRTDLYSLGVLFWTLLVGRGTLPFEGGPLELLHAIVQKRPMPVHEVRRDVPQVLALIIDKVRPRRPRAASHTIVLNSVPCCDPHSFSPNLLMHATIAHTASRQILCSASGCCCTRSPSPQSRCPLRFVCADRPSCSGSHVHHLAHTLFRDSPARSIYGECCLRMIMAVGADRQQGIHDSLAISKSMSSIVLTTGL